MKAENNVDEVVAIKERSHNKKIILSATIIVTKTKKI